RERHHAPRGAAQPGARPDEDDLGARGHEPVDQVLGQAAVDLRAIYEGEQGLRPEDDVIAYCRIGERSSHTWFVLTYLLGYRHVRNYDGSWTEWGNAVRAPIRVGSEP
ncbi:MAG: sulfurtransferase, partial [Gemmatimonadota bacterium]